ncbi:MAG: hypothetical protein Tsb0032_41520 [Kiloniellaceae bacterium]
MAQKFTSTTLPASSAKLTVPPSSASKAMLGAGAGGSEKVKFSAKGPSGAGGAPPSAAIDTRDQASPATAGGTATRAPETARTSAASPAVARVFLMTPMGLTPTLTSMDAKAS